MSEDREGKTSPSGRELCPRCGGPMNFQAEKIDRAADAGSEDVVAEFHTCPACKYVLQRAAL
jgi:DNA-directed RNA polymerase subunit M/transcription elongation factor TFIIS